MKKRPQSYQAVLRHGSFAGFLYLYALITRRRLKGGSGHVKGIIIKKEDFRSIILDSLSKHKLTLKEVSQLLPDVDSSKILMEMVE